MSNKTDGNYHYSLEGVDRLPSGVMELLIDNDELFRLLKYNETPYDPSKTITFSDKKALLNQDFGNTTRRIYFTAFNDFVIDSEEVQLRIYNAGFRPSNNILVAQYVGIDVVCHNKLITIKDEENRDSDRLAKIIQIILKEINGNGVKGGIGVMQPIPNREVPLLAFNDNFQGYRMKLEIASD